MKQFFFGESWFVYFAAESNHLPPLAARLEIPQGGSVDNNLDDLKNKVSRKLSELETTLQSFNTDDQVHQEFMKLREEHIDKVLFNSDQTEGEKREALQRIFDELTAFEGRISKMESSSSLLLNGNSVDVTENSDVLSSSNGSAGEVLTNPLPPVIVSAPHPEWKGFWKDSSNPEEGATIDFGTGPNALALERSVTLYDIASRRFDTAHMPKKIEVTYAESSMKRFEALARKGDKRYEAISAFLKEHDGKLEAQFGLFNPEKIDYFFTVNGKKEHVPVFQGDIVRPVESTEAGIVESVDVGAGSGQPPVEEGRALEPGSDNVGGASGTDKSAETLKKSGDYMQFFNLIRFDAATSVANGDHQLIGISKPVIEAKRELSEALLQAGCNSSLIEAIDFSQPKEKEFNVVIKRNDQKSDILFRGNGDSAELAFTKLIRNISDLRKSLSESGIGTD